MRKGRDILSEYGRDSGAGNQPRATTGGIKSARDVMNYRPPQGPIGIMRTAGPGLGGSNAGNRNCPTANDGAAGRPGIGGDKPCPDGSQ